MSELLNQTPITAGVTSACCSVRLICFGLTKELVLRLHPGSAHFLPDPWCRTAIFNQCAPRIFETCNTWLLRGIDFFFIGLSNKKMAVVNTIITIWCEWKITPFFLCQIGKSIMYFLVCWRIFVISLRVPWHGKGWKLLVSGYVRWTSLSSTLICNQKKRYFRVSVIDENQQSGSFTFLKMVLFPY